MYDRLLSPSRFRDSTVGGRTLVQEYGSDRGRLIQSSPFRRLQQKAQVFPLEANASVRSRLTHSLEVANIGAQIAELVVEESPGIKAAEEKSKEKYGDAFIVLCENACLLHDIGNPPFGHFGECAVRDWFGKNGQKKLKASLGQTTDDGHGAFQAKLLSDFVKFDGNAQGLRVVTRLQGDYSAAGLNLSLSLLSGYLKYVAPAYDENVGKSGKAFRKKPGFFYSEEEIVKRSREVLRMLDGVRHPAAFVMEAADDIAYCLSDMEDALEKRLVTEEELRTEIRKQWIEACHSLPEGEREYLERFLSEYWEQPKDTYFKGFQTFRTKLINDLANAAARTYLDEEPAIMSGSRQVPLFRQGTKESVALEALKKTAVRKVFRAPEVVNIELAGYRAIEGLLDGFGRLLDLSWPDFKRVAEGHTTGGGARQLDVESRLFSKLPRNYFDCYQAAVARSMEEPEEQKRSLLEWYYRAHLLVDYVSSMTDDHALRTFQALRGILVDGRPRG
ncbi:MAG: dGTPase [Thermoanaerobaculia bacterium]